MQQKRSPLQHWTPAQAETSTDETFDPGFILQTGAFQQFESAQSESERQKLLGLEVNVKQQELLRQNPLSGPIRTLYQQQYTESGRAIAKSK